MPADPRRAWTRWWMDRKAELRSHPCRRRWWPIRVHLWRLVEWHGDFNPSTYSVCARCGVVS